MTSLTCFMFYNHSYKKAECQGSDTSCFISLSFFLLGNDQKKIHRLADLLAPPSPASFGILPARKEREEVRAWQK